MKHKKLILLLLNIIWVLNLNAQDSLKTKIQKPILVNIAYLGAVAYPGMKLGVELPMIEKTIIKKNGKLITKDRFININYGFYHHSTFHSNNWLTAEWLKRRSNPKGFMTEANVGLGYSRTFLTNATYEVDDNGQIIKINSAGNNYLHFTMGVGLGYTFKKETKIPITGYLKTNLMILTPYNHFIYLRPTLELGVIAPLNFWNKKTKQLVKSKK